MVIIACCCYHLKISNHPSRPRYINHVTCELPTIFIHVLTIARFLRQNRPSIVISPFLSHTYTHTRARAHTHTQEHPPVSKQHYMRPRTCHALPRSLRNLFQDTPSSLVSPLFTRRVGLTRALWNYKRCLSALLRKALKSSSAGVLHRHKSASATAILIVHTPSRRRDFTCQHRSSRHSCHLQSI
ncbi:uncharacterized protein K489DRAFT_68128 [Dissoconium aciculare CBS 342.82]|uniref:Uncharacterized protein n=1 Tax=Dissoconium aciculare CBS 342.82 TaxID=1314786 RepID=A0A6J3LW72_9PEZI|nr:uncharacterized protein K489DRAFT_68128 [Dissoconium aciculare CBS 342.82]KAF1819514.1 hypothetical protein K489DRAFT_68128 [Dissoconium aciculare CBS 342.82]